MADRGRMEREQSRRSSQSRLFASFQNRLADFGVASWSGKSILYTLKHELSFGRVPPSGLKATLG